MRSARRRQKSRSGSVAPTLRASSPHVSPKPPTIRKSPTPWSPAQPIQRTRFSGMSSQPVSREWRELRDAVGERRPVRGGIAGERKPEQALDDVVPDDPDERRGLQDLDPGESDHA